MKEKKNIERTDSVWCSGWSKNILKELKALQEDIQANEPNEERRDKKVEYLTEVSDFVKKITWARVNVEFCFSGNAEAMQKALIELQKMFKEWELRVDENCSLVPPELKENVKVFRVKKRTIVLIDI